MSSFLRRIVLTATVCASAIHATGQQDQSPSEYIATTLAQVLSSNGTTPPVERIPRSSTDLRRVVSTNLSPKLLLQSVALSGTTYKFEELKSSEEVTVIVLRYPSSNLCAKKKKTLEHLKGFFINSEMLVRFSATQLGELLVVASSENSGDARIVHTLDSLPEKFARDTKNHSR